jgi:hypothetical protein
MKKRPLEILVLFQVAGAGLVAAFGDIIGMASHSPSSSGLLAAKVSSFLVDSAIEGQDLAGGFCPRISSPSSLEFLRDYVSPNRLDTPAGSVLFSVRHEMAQQAAPKEGQIHVPYLAGTG